MGDAHTTLALADSADLHLTTFRGIPLDDNALILVTARLGDANLDNHVDAFDLNLLAAHWQQSNALWSAGDFTGDGKIDAFDLNVLAASWQVGFNPALQASSPASILAPGAVPEPATAALLALGAGALLVRRRRPPA
jgi:hypothetical protein